jgi:ubiquitin carboxyl-terminal hydrolase 2/21
MQQFQKYSGNGLTGLGNLGNTCFMNSCLQALSHTYELNELLDRDNFTRKIKENCRESLLLREWDELRRMMWSKNCVIAPNRFLKAVHHVAAYKDIKKFTGFEQNDLPEFLLFLIDCFHTSTARKINMTINGTAENETDEIALLCFQMIQHTYSKEYSEIWNLFFAVHVSEITSLTEPRKILSRRPEPFFMLDLPIPDNRHTVCLYDCINLYVEGEVLEGENAWKNEATGKKENVAKRISFWSLPNILVVSLKRFNARQQKNQVFVDFPLENLDLSSYVIGYKKPSYKYDLYAICNHSGGVLGGHYTAYIKNANNAWYHHNDTTVTPVALETSLVTPRAYCLFFRKQK